MPDRTPKRKPNARLSQSERNKLPWPQSCISTKTRSRKRLISSVTAAVSPYEATRNEVRDLIGRDRFVLVHVATPLEICERRDVKGLYAKSRRGEIKGLTGIDDPYEAPAAPDITLTTTDCDADTCAARIEAWLDRRGIT